MELKYSDYDNPSLILITISTWSDKYAYCNKKCSSQSITYTKYILQYLKKNT